MLSAHGAAVTETAGDAEALNALAAKYLDLWLEYWASSLASPETAAIMARFLPPDAAAPWGGIGPDAGLGSFDAIRSWAGARPGAGDGPAPVPAASDARDGRADELEKRVAELERRLVAIEKPAVLGSPRKPRRRTRQV